MPGWIGLPLLLVSSGLAAWAVGVGVVWGWLVRPVRKTPGVALAAGDPLDPADVELSGEEVSLPMADGSRTWAWVVEGGNPEGPWVVMLHAHGDSRFGSLSRASVYAGDAAKLVLPDRRGQGESESRDSPLGAGEAADVAAMLEAMPGGESAGLVLVGVEGGAAAALEAAVLLATRVRGVIVESPPPRWDAPVRAYMEAWRVPAWLFLPAAGWVVRHVSPRVEPPEAVAAAVAVAGRVGCPVLAIYIKGEEAWVMEGSRAVAEAVVGVPGGQGRVAVMQGDAAGYRTVVGEFLREVAANADIDPTRGVTPPGPASA